VVVDDRGQFAVSLLSGNRWRESLRTGGRVIGASPSLPPPPMSTWFGIDVLAMDLG